MVYYFAYGSNMDPDRMRARKIRFSKRIWGHLGGYALTFDKIAADKEDVGYATIVRKDGSLVEGAVYCIDEEGVRILDRFERVRQGDYGRLMVRVKTAEGILPCITYVAKKVKAGLKPDKAYIAYLLAAKDLHSKEYHSRILDWETAD